MANRRWLKIGSGIGATVTSIVGLFVLLSVIYGFEIVDLTGNFSCEGTYDNPCISEFLVKNPNSYDVDIYSKDEIKLEFSPEIEDWALFVPDGRCSATGKCACDLKNGKKIGYEDWRCVDFTNKTKPRQDKQYVFRFKKYSNTRFRLVGIKKDSRDDVKWTFGANNEELDPVWYGDDDILLVWGHSTNNYPNYNDGSTSNSWGSTRDVHTSIGYDTSQLHIVQHPNKEEKLLIWIDTTEDIHAKFWSGSAWSDYSEIETDGHTSDRFTIAVAVETNSGDYLVAYSRGPTAYDDYVAYQTYIDGTGWSGVQTINLDLGAQTENMVLVPNPNSDEIILLASEQGDTLDAWIWDGDSFENHVQLTTDLEDGSSGDPTTYVPEVPFAAAWVNSTGEAIVIWGEESVEAKSRRWNGASWDAEKTQFTNQFTTDMQYAVLRSSMWEDKIRGGFFDNDNDVWGFELNSSLDIVNLTEFTTTGYTNYPYKAIDVVMPEAGKFIYAWSHTANGYYMVDSYDYASDAQTFTTNDIRTVHGDFTGDMAMFSCNDDANDLSVFMYNVSASSESYTDNLETSMEETFSHQIQANVYYGEEAGFNPNITECGNLTEANSIYYIQNDLQADVTCLRIQADNITVEGQDYTIIFAESYGGGDYPYGVLMHSNDSTIRNMTIQRNTTSSCGADTAVYMDIAVYNNTIDNVDIDGKQCMGAGVSLYGDDHTVTNVYILDVDQYPTTTWYSDNCLFENITFNWTGGNGGFSMFDPDNSKNIVIRNAYSYNDTDDTYVVFFWDDQNSTNITIYNSNFSDDDIYVNSADSELILVNVSYDKSEEYVNAGNLTVKWYLSFQVNDTATSSGLAVNWTLDDKDNEIASGSTDANGFQENFEVIQYINESGTMNDRNDHTLQTTKTGYVTNTTVFTLDDNKFFQIWMAEEPNLSAVLNLAQFQFSLCGPDFENATAEPIGQTPSVGTINLTNDGGSAGTARIKYIGSLNTGWTLFAANSSQIKLTLTTAYQNLVGLGVSETQMVWMYANCSYVSANPGVNIDFDII